MKRYIWMLLICLMSQIGAFAQADKVCGNYEANHEGKRSKVKIFKMDNGKYRAQVYWVDNMKNPDGSLRTDVKNPDKSKRNVPSDKIVLIQEVSYDAKENKWNNGEIYDPTSGKVYSVELFFDEPGTLTLRGYITIFGKKVGKKVFWKKID